MQRSAGKESKKETESKAKQQWTGSHQLGGVPSDRSEHRYTSVFQLDISHPIKFSFRIYDEKQQKGGEKTYIELNKIISKESAVRVRGGTEYW